MSKECHAALGYYCDSFLSIMKNIARKEKKKQTQKPKIITNRILRGNSCYCGLLIKVCRHPEYMVNLEGSSAPNGMDRIYCGEKS